MYWSKEEIIEGIRCEECYPRPFGVMVNDNADNLFLYKDLGGNTRCFCRKHMSYCGGKTNLNHDAVPCFGAQLKSEILK